MGESPSPRILWVSLRQQGHSERLWALIGGRDKKAMPIRAPNNNANLAPNNNANLATNNNTKLAPSHNVKEAPNKNANLAPNGRINEAPNKNTNSTTTDRHT